jgi:hypothetical protein
MDWNAAIERNREALKRILASLVAMAGLAAGADPASATRGDRVNTLPRHLHRAVLKLLRPAEAAARRLVIVMARGLVVAPPHERPRRPRPNPTVLRTGVGTGIILAPAKAAALPHRPAARKVSLPLLDPLRLPRQWRPIRTSQPRILFPGLPGFVPAPLRKPATPDDPVSGVRLALRLAALARALDDLPAHALRFARWRAARLAEAAREQDPRTFRAGRPRFGRIWPLRPGNPPGWRRKPTHEVHDVLNVVHGLAFWALETPDTS